MDKPIKSNKEHKKSLVMDIIARPCISKCERENLMKKEAEEYFAIHKSDRHPLIKKFYKSLHFLKWAIKLLAPDFLIGHPNLWDNLKTLRKHPQFKPFRMALMAWFIFTISIISVGVYSIATAPKSEAATISNNTQTQFDAGTYNNTQWNATNNWVEGTNTTPNPIWELPNNASTSGWQNMTGNVLLMHMNDTSGPIIDSSGQGNNGTATGGVTYSAPGKLNTALSFDGVSGSVDITGLTSTSKNYTFSFWVNSSAVNSQYKYLADIQTGRLILAWNGFTSGQLSFYDGTWHNFGTNTINDGTWHKIDFVFSGTSGSLYIDGAQFGSSFTYIPTDLGGSIAIGSNNAGTNGYFKGSMDEITIFNRALSATEITNIYKQQAILYSGTYTSNIKNTGSSSQWNNISWVQGVPVGKELPDNAVSETAYPSGNANMTGNVLLMHMNDTSGPIVDSSGQGNNGTVTGGVTYSATGKLNTALSFDGVDGTVNLGSSSSLNTAQMTFSGWVYINGLNTNNGTLFSRWGNSASTNSYFIGIKPNADTVVIYINNGLRYTTPSLSLNTWFYFTITNDGTTISVYENGQYLGGGAAGTFVSSPSTVSSVGYDVARSNYPFKGSMDEVAIYNRALSATEVLYNYKRGASNIKYQVRSCNDSACSGESFAGPSGTGSDYYEWSALSIPSLSFTLANVPNNQYFQYKAFFETASSTLPAELKSVTVDYTLLNSQPSTPTNSAPASGASGQGLLPTLTGSTYSDPDSDPHQASQWQIATSTSDFTATTWDSGATTTALTSVIMQAPELIHNSQYAWRVRYQDNVNNWSSYSATTTFTTNSIAKPSNVTPTASSTKVNLLPTLTSSAFVDGEPGHTNQASQWQVATSTNFSPTVWDSNATTTALTSIIVGTALSHNTDYYWRVRYQDNTSQWSAYSTTTGFTTNVINTPTNSSPLDKATVLTLTPLLTASPFSDEQPGYTHTASQWQVDDNSDFSSPAYDSGTTASGEVSRAVPSGLLSNFSTYYWRVKYKDSGGEWSNWSIGTKFSISISSTAVSVKPVFGNTTVGQGDTVKIDAQVVNFTDGSPLNNATSTINIYNPSGTKIVSDATMAYITGSHGIYRYTYVIPSVSGSYLYSVTSTSGSNSGYGASNFQVRTTASDVSSIKTIVTSEQTAQSAERTAQASSRTNVSNILTDTSTTLPNQINTATTSIITKVNANKAKLDTINTNVNSLISNLDILIGAMIVTQSSVNDASASATAFVTNLTNTTNDFYKNAVVTFTSGTLNGQSRRISAYDSTTKIITLDPALTSTPANGDAFTIVKQDVRVQEQVAKNGAAQATERSTQANFRSNTTAKLTTIGNKIDTITATLNTVNTSLDSAQTTINALRTSQQKEYTVKLSDISQIQAGNTYRAKLTILNFESNPVDASTTPTILIYDATRAIAQTTTTMTKLSTGVYEFTSNVAVSSTSGLWESVVHVNVGGTADIVRNDYWQVTGSPAQVVINSMSDTSVPSISAAATITNEGGSSYEYKYEWCVVKSQIDQCGGSNDVYYASAAKLIAPGNSFNPTLTATVPKVGNYWFKLVVYFGTKASGASRTFSATVAGATPTQSTGGGGGTSPATLQNIYSQMTKTRQDLNLNSQKLVTVLNTLNIINPTMQSLLSVTTLNTGNLKSIQNKVADLKAISSATRQIVEQQGVKPVVETYMKFNSVEINFLITNPANTKQVVKFKAYLPKEAKPEYILNSNGLAVNYDVNANAYFVSGNITLSPKQTITRTVEMKDIWIFTAKELNSLRNQADTLLPTLKNTQYSAQGAILKNDIDSTLDILLLKQKGSYSSPQNHVVVYRENEARMTQIKNNLEMLKGLVVQAGAARGVVGRIGGIQTFSTWGIILSVVFGFGLLAAVIFAMWRNQTMLAAIAMGMDKREVMEHFGTSRNEDEKREHMREKYIAKASSPSVLLPFMWKKILKWVAVSGFITIVGVVAVKFIPMLVSSQEIKSGNKKTQASVDSTMSQKKSIGSQLIPNLNQTGKQTFYNVGNDTHQKSDSSIIITQVSSTTTSTDSIATQLSKVEIINTPTGWLNVRSKPSISEKLLGKVYPGKVYTFEAKKNGWYYLVIPKGIDGWVFGKYVKLVK